MSLKDLPGLVSLQPRMCSHSRRSRLCHTRPVFLRKIVKLEQNLPHLGVSRPAKPLTASSGRTCSVIDPKLLFVYGGEIQGGVMNTWRTGGGWGHRCFIISLIISSLFACLVFYSSQIRTTKKALYILQYSNISPNKHLLFPFIHMQKAILLIVS